MAGRKRVLKSTSADGHPFTVVLEEMRGHFKVFGEAQELLREQMDRRFEDVNRRFDGVDRRLDGIENRLDGVEVRLGRVENDVGLVKIAVLEHARELKHIRVVLEKKVDRDEVEPIVERVVARGR